MRRFLLMLLRPCLLWFILMLPSVSTLAHLPGRSVMDLAAATVRPSSSIHILLSRRGILLASSSAAAAALAVPTRVTAAADGTTTIMDLFETLKRVPTFCIVNSEGAAYMVVKAREGVAKGYAFLTFEGALAVLGDAQRAAEKGGYADLWKDATITVIPADIAVRLALKKTDRTSQKEQSLGTLLDIIPGVEDRDDALRLDKKFQDQGKVPLFYYEGLKLTSPDGKVSTPVYFQKTDLVNEWIQQNPGAPAPRLRVLDLLTVFQATLRGRTEGLPNHLVFVPNQQTVDVSKELKARGLTPYKVDRMIV